MLHLVAAKLRRFKTAVVLCALLGVACAASAQTTVLQGTVTDPSSTVWQNATWTYSLVNPTGGPLVNLCGGSLDNSVIGTLNSSGVFATGALTPNSCIAPAGTSWQLVICPLASSGCQTLPPVVMVSGFFNAGNFASANIVTPSFVISKVGYGYNTAEVKTPIPTGSLLGITSPSASCFLELFNGVSWTCLSASTSGINQLTLDVTAGPAVGSAVATAVNLPGHVALTGTPATGDSIVASDATHATWSSSGGVATLCPNTVATNSSCYEYPNDATGTTLNLLACFVGATAFHSQTIATCPVATSTNSGTDGNTAYLGVVVAGAGTTGMATVQVAGVAPWICDSAISLSGNWVEPSPTVAGECHAPPSGGFTPSPNEDPQGNSVLGRPGSVTTAAGQIAQIVLLPFGSYSTGAPQAINFSSTGHKYANLTILEDGSTVAAMAQMYQAPSDDPLPYALESNGIVFNQGGTSKGVLLGNMGQGASGNDITFDSLSHGDNSPPDEMLRLNGSQYQVPSNCGSASPPCNASGTISLSGHSGQFDPGNSSGLFVLNLTGNATTFTPLTDDNFGHFLTFVITPNAFTWTWPSGTPGFINAPTVSGVSFPVISQFFFDGTNYQCAVGCAPIVQGFGSGSNGNGFWKIDPTGTLQEWQPTALTIGNDTTVTFPVAFSNAASIQITIPQLSPISDVGYCFVIAGTVTTTQFQAHSANISTDTCTWSAIGH